MARARTHEFFVKKIREYGRNRRDLKPPAIRELLRSVSAPEGVGGIPSTRTISRILQEFEDVPEPKKQEYDWIRWPESFIEARLPWEASRCTLDLLHFYSDRQWPRPTVSQTVWFWRFTLSAPDMPIVDRVELAVNFAEVEGELKTFDAIVRMTEERLASKAWQRSPVQPKVQEACKLCDGAGVTWDIGYGLWFCTKCGYTGGPDRKELPDLPGFFESIDRPETKPTLPVVQPTEETSNKKQEARSRPRSIKEPQ